MSFSIAGKTAIVTGAANGVGLAIARHFIARGANVMMADMDEAGLTEELGEAARSEEGAARIFVGDLREKLTHANLLSATIDAFERVDILVNASRQVLTSDPLDPEDRSLPVLLEQNLTAGYRLSQLVARRMIAQAEERGESEEGAGSIITLTSIAAERMHPDLLAYSVSTAAANQLSRALAVALAPRRIRVNALAIGSVMSESLRATLAEDGEKREEIIAHTPLGHIATAAEIAETAQFLASEASRFITGQVIVADGGRTLLDTVATPAH